MAKVNLAGSKLVYSTYLGGSSADRAYGIATNARGNAFVTGVTRSADFPTTEDAFQPAFNGVGVDGFVVSLDAAGSDLVFSTSIGVKGDDKATGIAIDPSGATYVSGWNGSMSTERVDAFVKKLSTDGSALLYTISIGGNRIDIANAIAVDSSGNAYVTGGTASTDFPTERPIQANYAGPSTGISRRQAGDAVVAKLVPTVQLNSAHYSVNEEAENIIVTLRTDGSGDVVTVDYFTSDGTALAGEDYTSSLGTITFAAWDTTEKTFAVPIIGDDVPEDSETFNVSLRNLKGNAFWGSPNPAVVTIIGQIPTGETGGRGGACAAPKDHGAKVDPGGVALVVGIVGLWMVRRRLWLCSVIGDRSSSE